MAPVLIFVSVAFAFAWGGAASVSRLSGPRRALAVALLVAAPVAVLWLLASPLPLRFGWTLDPGYDTTSWLPQAVVVAEIAVAAGLSGVIIAAGVRALARRA